MSAAIIRNLPSKTGKSLPEWIQILADSGLTGRTESIALLKSKGLGYIQAQTIFTHQCGRVDYENLQADDLFTDPTGMELYQYLQDKITSLNGDVRIEPCKTYIPFYRKNQFAIVAPAGKGQLKLGLALPKNYQHPKLETAGSFGTTRVTRKTKLGSKEDINGVFEAIQRAYIYN